MSGLFLIEISLLLPVYRSLVPTVTVDHLAHENQSSRDSLNFQLELLDVLTSPIGDNTL